MAISSNSMLHKGVVDLQNLDDDTAADPSAEGAMYFSGSSGGTARFNFNSGVKAPKLKIGSGAEVTTILDEDNMATDSATALATQQSIKAYVDAQVTAQDLDFATDSGSGNVDLDSQTLTLAGSAGLDVTHSGQTITYALDLAELSAETSIASGDTFAFVQEAESGDPSKKITFDNMAAKLAGTGLASSAGVLGTHLAELSAVTAIASGDTFAIVQEAESGDPTKKITFDNMGAKLAGDGLGASAGVLEVNVDGTGIEINSDTLRLKDSGVTLAKMANLADMKVLGNVSGGAAAPAAVAILDEDAMGSDSATSLATQQSIKAYVDAQDAAIASDTLTFTNKTFDANGSGNVLSNIDIGNMTAAVIVLESEGIGSNDNDTTLPTSAAVKDYVDTQVTAQDLDTAGDSGTGAVDLDSQSLTIAGTANEIVTVASNQAITIGLPDDVTIGQDLTVTRNATVTGNLTVNGSQFKVDGETVVIDDTLVEMGTVNKAAPGSSTATKDKGHLLHHHNGSAASIQFIGYDVTNESGKFVVKAGVTDDGDGSISGGSFAPFKAGATEVTSLAASAAVTLSGDITLGGASDTAIDMAADSLYFRDADGTLHRDTVADIMTATAGVGLAAASGVLAVDLNELSAAAVAVAADSIAIIDATDNGSKKESIADLVTAMAGTGLSATNGVLAVDAANASAANVDVSADSLQFIDNSDSDAVKVESFADLMTATAGDGLAAASGVLKVDVSDFAGTGLEDDSSENLRIAASAAGEGLKGGGGSALALDLAELTAVSAIASGDTFAIVQEAESGDPSKKITFDNMAAKLAGSGLDASAGVLSVDGSDFITNGADNRIVTCASADTLNGEANLTFDGTSFSLGASSPAGIMLTGSIAIESNALPDTMYAIDIANTAGNNPNSRVRANAFVTYSERALKSEIKDLTNPMAKLNALRPVTYNWKASDTTASGWKSEEIGFIADEVQQVIPQIVATTPDGYAQGIDYSKLTALLTQAVKVQDTEIKDLKAQLSKVLKALELKG